MTNAQKLIDTGVVDIPWPSMIDGWLHIGTRFQESAICKERCKTKECRQAQGKSVELVCNQGLTYYQLSLAGHTIIVYGVTGSDKSHLPKYPQLKLQLKGRTVTREEFMNWSARLHALFDTLETVEKELLSQVLHPLHDTMRVAGEVREIAGKIVEKDRHKSFEENFESSPREVKSLFKAADMLVDTFESAAIYFNPEAAKYGKPRDVEVYKLLDKLRLIMNTAGVSRVRKQIRFDGRGYGKYSLYESFKLLPLALLQNAVKYAQSGEVLLRCDENDQGLKIAVTSEGPLIEQDELEKIFEPGYRGKWAVKMEDEGMGVGLHIAKTVATANGITIHVESMPLNRQIANVSQARNTFWFVVRPPANSK